MPDRLRHSLRKAPPKGNLLHRFGYALGFIFMHVAGALFWPFCRRRLPTKGRR